MCNTLHFETLKDRTNEPFYLFRLCLKVNAFCFILKSLFYNYITSRQAVWALLSCLVSELLHSDERYNAIGLPATIT